MIVAFFTAALLIVFAGVAWICDRMDAHEELVHNEYVARCRAYHPTSLRRWE